MKKNGFFDDSEPLNSHRANAAIQENMLDEVNLVEQCINSNSNTDRGHYYPMLLRSENNEKPIVNQKEALIIHNGMNEDTNYVKINKMKITNLLEKHSFDNHASDHQTNHANISQNSKGAAIKIDDLEKPKLEIQVDSIVSDPNIKTKDEQKSDEKEFNFRGSTIHSVENTDQPI